jgi:hypothetical protein
MARPKGSKNKKSIQWEALGGYITEQGLTRLMTILETCDDQTFLRNYVQLLEYFKPKLKRLEVDETDKKPAVIKVLWDEILPNNE